MWADWQNPLGTVWRQPPECPADCRRPVAARHPAAGAARVFLAAATAQSACSAGTVLLAMFTLAGHGWPAQQPPPPPPCLQPHRPACWEASVGPLLNEAHIGVLFIGASSGSMLLLAHSCTGWLKYSNYDFQPDRCQPTTSGCIWAGQHCWRSGLRQQNSWLLATFDLRAPVRKGCL